MDMVDTETTFDPALVGRLSRPAARPGVVDHAQPRAMLDRHQAMVAGLPLAELVSRHAGPAADFEGTGTPIVYARPGTAGSGAVGPGTAVSASAPSASAPSTPVLSTPDSGAGAAGAGPVVAARSVRPAAGAAAPPLPSLTGAPVAGGTSGSAAGAVVPAVHPVTPTSTPVVQRLVAASPAPAASPPDIVLPSGSPSSDPRAPSNGPREGAAPEPPPIPPSSTPLSSTPPRSSGKVTSPAPAVANSAEVGGTAPPTGHGALPLVLARPVPSTASRRPGATGPAVPELVAPEPAVVGQVAPEPVVVAARRPRPRAGGVPLLLADPAAATARSGREDPAIARPATPDRVLPAVPGRPAAGIANTARHSRSAARPGRHDDAPAGGSVAAAAATPTPATAPVDVARIVDLVHDRFVRRLAVEAERRGAR